MTLQRLAKEDSGCRLIAGSAQIRSNCAPQLVNRPIQEDLAAFYLNVGLISTPGAAHGQLKRHPTADELAGVSHYPSQNGRGRYCNSEFRRDSSIETVGTIAHTKQSLRQKTIVWRTMDYEPFRTFASLDSE